MKLGIVNTRFTKTISQNFSVAFDDGAGRDAADLALPGPGAPDSADPRTGQPKLPHLSSWLPIFDAHRKAVTC